jgi:hypothetical protein
VVPTGNYPQGPDNVELSREGLDRGVSWPPRNPSISGSMLGPCCELREGLGGRDAGGSLVLVFFPLS